MQTQAFKMLKAASLIFELEREQYKMSLNDGNHNNHQLIINKLILNTDWITEKREMWSEFESS